MLIDTTHYYDMVWVEDELCRSFIEPATRTGGYTAAWVEILAKIPDRHNGTNNMRKQLKERMYAEQRNRFITP